SSAQPESGKQLNSVNGAIHITILFSSGTTGSPKAIPWEQTTPIPSVVDAHLHQDIRPGDVLCWPTNMGWMMGPWLVHAALMNMAAMALFYGALTTRQFSRFVQDAGVTMLGLVPSLVSAWRDGGYLDGLDWSGIRVFSAKAASGSFPVPPLDPPYGLRRGGASVSRVTHSALTLRPRPPTAATTP
ncbi:MAG TPA: AMP-dependent synthetase, partial [Planctomycetaceae bacterium]|nr:AMP-dependent synthetase [Planctomycetaceae bacterium]